MATPLASEKVIRAILKTLVHTGVLATAADTAAIEAIPVNATDADIDTVIASLTHGAVPITGVSTTDLISDTDLTCWVDADMLPIVLAHNYFRVAAWGTTLADVSKDTEWLSISRQRPTPGQPVNMVLGPLSSRLNGAVPLDLVGYTAAFKIGAYHEGVAPGDTHRHYGVMTGGSTALTGNGYSLSTSGLSIWTKKQMELSANVYLGIVDSASNEIRGGFAGLNANTATLFVGPYPSGGSVAAITLGKVSGTNDFALDMTKVHNYATLYVSNATSSPYSTCLAVNGRPLIASRTPTYALYNTYGATVGVAPTVSAFGSQSITTGGDVVVLAQSPAPAGYASDLFRAMADAPASGSYNLFAGYVWSGVAYTRMFRVTGSGNAYCAGAFTGGGADLAEWMLADQQHEPGTVVVLRGGVVVASDRYRAAGVVGVVSSAPGLVMNGRDDEHQDHILVARAGMVPVKFSTEFGGVDGNGEMLCAGPGGHCVRAPQFPEPGTVVGKAMGTLHRAPDGSITTGVIMAVVG